MADSRWDGNYNVPASDCEAALKCQMTHNHTQLRTTMNKPSIVNTLAACCTIAACFGLMVYTLLEWAAQ